MILGTSTEGQTPATTLVTVEGERLTIKGTGHRCTVPENSWAKLMYYLNCVNCVISLEIPSNITNYDEYNNLSFDDKNYILMLAEVLNPTLFEKNHIFIYENNLTSSNQFFDISYTKLAAAATKEFLVAGVRVLSLKVMAYKYHWKEEFYNEPMSVFHERLNDIHYGKAEKYREKDKSTSQEKSKTCLLI